ncbi:14998_t:CDS:1, partial [Gigaspora margarita]
GSTKATIPKVATPKTMIPEQRKAISKAATPKTTTPRQRLLEG